MKKWISFPLLAAFALVPTMSIAGANNAVLKCKGIRHHPVTTLSGDVPGDTAGFALTLDIDGITERLGENGDSIHVIAAFDRKVFTLAIGRSDHRDLLFYAVPASMKVRIGRNRSIDATFDAVIIEAPRPGFVGPGTDQSMIRDVRATCSYHFAI